MNIHEYQVKQIFKEYNLPIPKGVILTNYKNSIDQAIDLGGKMWVIKAQIHSGGRGLAGGVKIAKSLKDVEKITKNMIGMKLITNQTGPEGKIIEKVYIEKAVDIEYELYLAIALDRALETPIIIASSKGGMDIEKISKESPEYIIKIPIDTEIGFKDFQGIDLANKLNLPKDDIPRFIKFAKTLYKIYNEDDAELIEVNPLVKSKNGNYIALDGKMGLDDSALYRHHDIEDMRDLHEENKNESEAKEYGLSYVQLDGNVGCMVNGAGLAMATMDIIKHVGGNVANFLDVGGGAKASTVAKGFEIILRNKKIKSIFVNIFGGIVRCDRIANGIIEATKNVNINVPVVVRLNGTNAQEAKELLKNSNIENIIVASNLEDGAKKAVELSIKL
ncbi:MAG: ADP-forming succinate--CoA ligase subunit beta [Arcobacter sp.]|nr:ADP-forming succinate--CoA ligase subunit beta [Arcobacter sp.]